MSADDLRHRVSSVTGGVGELDTAGEQAVFGLDAVAERVPAEYREAYLEGFARARAVREDTAA